MNQYHEGYFNYKTNGFGTICNNINDTIFEIISTIKNNCSIKRKYLIRIKNFFKYNDYKNCERLYKTLTNNKYIKYEMNNKNNKYQNYLLVISSLVIIKYKINLNQ